MAEQWVSQRARRVEASGVRKIFELGRGLTNPIDLSIGQPQFPVPETVRSAAVAAIEAGRNGYTASPGIPELRQTIRERVRREFGPADREVLITSGTSGGLTLALLTILNPGDEIIFFDPYFVSYPQLVTLAGGVPIVIDTYPDFCLDLDRVQAAITPRTKAILVNSPSNPTGTVTTPDVLRDLARRADRHGILLISDEIYHAFTYDEPFVSPARWNENTLVIDGFGKTYGMTGWRVGYTHGPAALIEQMAKLQAYTFVCAPAPFQHACLAAEQVDTAPLLADFRRKRDWLCTALAERFELTTPGGAFYLFPRAPWGTATEFVRASVAQNLLVVPGDTFSARDSHFRISFAASDEKLAEGIEILLRVAAQGR